MDFLIEYEILCLAKINFIFKFTLYERKDNNMKEQIAKIQENAKQEINSSSELSKLNDARIKYLGDRKSVV